MHRRKIKDACGGHFVCVLVQPGGICSVYVALGATKPAHPGVGDAIHLWE